MQGFACQLAAIPTADRPRYDLLVKRIRAAIRKREEVSGGYGFLVDGKAIRVVEAAEWISMERLYCPFLVIQIATAGGETDWSFTMTGPTGVQALIDSVFPGK